MTSTQVATRDGDLTRSGNAARKEPTDGRRDRDTARPAHGITRVARAWTGLPRGQARRAARAFPISGSSSSSTTTTRPETTGESPTASGSSPRDRISTLISESARIASGQALFLVRATPPIEASPADSSSTVRKPVYETITQTCVVSARRPPGRGNQATHLPAPAS